jgi:hypothetical protein
LPRSELEITGTNNIIECTSTAMVLRDQLNRMLRNNPNSDEFYFDSTIKIRCEKKRLHEQDREDNNGSDRTVHQLKGCEDKRSKQIDGGV